MSDTPFDDFDLICMKAAMEEAKAAGERDEVPIGAVLSDHRSKSIIVRNGNRTREYNDPTAHAEILVIRDGCKLGGAQRIPDYDLYVTLEPCTMCAGAISFARIRRLVFAAADPKAGGVIHGGKFFDQPTCHHRTEIAHGLFASEAGEILRLFFKAKR